MLATVAVVVATHNLAYGVFVGVLCSSVFFAYKVGRLVSVSSTIDSSNNCRTYTVCGQVFFASSEQFMSAFNFKETLEKVTIDVTHAHFWDITAVSCLDKVIFKYQAHAIPVTVVGKSEATASILSMLSAHPQTIPE